MRWMQQRRQQQGISSLVAPRSVSFVPALPWWFVDTSVRIWYCAEKTAKEGRVGHFNGSHYGIFFYSYLYSNTC
jgi:hypothetical protein